MSSGDAVSLIKENLSIADLVKRYATLRKKGARLAACCPLHHEKTPSFYVDPTKGLYHCFGCGKGGDVINFCQEIEGFSFVEALDFLADLAGIELPKRGAPGPGRDLIEGLRKINEDACAFYSEQLKHNPKAQEYLREREISDNTVALFRLGYAPPQWDGLHHFLAPKCEPSLLAQSGLIKINQNGKPFDIFRDRIIFPIQDAYGHVVAFGGRLLPGEEGPKYINSPETPLYTKGKHLYNLNFAKAFLKKQPLVVVVEGYLDAIQVYQAGIGNVIASLGTAFTPEQARLIKRHTPAVTLNFDGDAAGFKAARTSIETMLRLDLDIRVMSLPENQDPDDFIRQQGAAAYREAMEGAAGFFDFLATYLSDGVDLAADPRQRSLVAQELCQTLACIEDPIVRGHYLDLVGKRLEISQSVVMQIYAQKGSAGGPVAPGKQNKRQQRRPAPGGPILNRLEQNFLYHVMHQDDFNQCLREEHREVLPRVLGQVFLNRPWVLEFVNAVPSPDFEDRLAAVPDEFRPLLRAIYFEEAFQEEGADRLEQLFPDLLRQMIDRLVHLNKQRMRLLGPGDEEKMRDHMRRNSQLMKQYHNL